MNENSKKIIQKILLSVFFFFILGLALYGSKDLVFGVKIKDVNIEDGKTYTESIIEIKGNAKNAKNLYINGREITRDKMGNFSENIALLPLYNQIEIRAKDKFENEDIKTYKVLYQAQTEEIEQEEKTEDETLEKTEDTSPPKEPKEELEIKNEEELKEEIVTSEENQNIPIINTPSTIKEE